MDNKFSREDKLRLFNNLIQSPEWELYKSELERQLAFNKAKINQAAENGDTNKLFGAESYRMALEFCLALPEKLKRENTDFFDRLYKKVVDKFSPAYSGMKSESTEE